MTNDFILLVLTTIVISFIHTLTGPDHYFPFIAMARARQWSFGKTLLVTIFCGLGHIGSSLAVGLIGVLLGWTLSTTEALDAVRGNVAGWVYIILGFLYLIWGIRKAILNQPHKHFDEYENGNIYVYEHRHGSSAPVKRFKVTPAVLFLIFVLGPCDPILPILTYPALQQSSIKISIIILVFTIITLLTMILMVALGYYGYRLVKTSKVERYVHAIAGATLFFSGVSIVFLGL